MNKIFIYLGYFVLFINCLLYLKSFSKNGKAFRIFTYYCVMMLVIQLTAHLLSVIKIHNLFLSHFYFIIQFVLLSFFYRNLLDDQFQKRIIAFNLILCPLLLIIQYAYDWRCFFRFNTFEIFITSLPLIVYATFHLYNLLNEKKIFYYTTIGILLYLFGSTVVFLTSNLLMTLHSKWSFITIFDLNVYLYLVYQLMIMYDLKYNKVVTNIS